MKYKLFLSLKSFLICLWIMLPVSPSSAQISDPEKEFLFANKLLEDKLFQLAGEQFYNYAERFPNNEQADDALFLSGESFYKAGTFESAFNAFKELELAYPQSKYLPRGRYRLAECQLARSNFAAAAELFKRIPVLHPQSEQAPHAHLAAGRVFIRAENHPAALNSFKDLIRDFPDSPIRLDAHLEVVNLYLNNENIIEAMAEIEGIFQAFGPDIQDARVFWLRGQIFEKLGQTFMSEEIYGKIVIKFPGSETATKATLRLAFLQGQRGDYSAAISKYDEILPLLTNDELRAKVLLNKGNLLQHLQKNDTALNVYKQGLHLPKTIWHADLLLEQAKLLISQDDLGQAEQSLRKLKESKIKNKAGKIDNNVILGETFVLLIELLIKAQKPHNALKEIAAFKRYFVQNKLLAPVMYYEAQIHENLLNDYSRAIRQYEMFIEQFPNNYRVDQAQFRLALCYEKLGDFKSALRVHQNHLLKYPGSDYLSEVEQRRQIIKSTIKFGTPTVSSELAKLLTKMAKGNIADIDYELGKIDFESRNFVSAINHFKKVLSKPDTVENRLNLLVELGRAYFFAGERKWLAGFKANTFYDSAAFVFDRLVNSANELENVAEYQQLLANTHRRREEISLADTLAGFAARFESASIPIKSKFRLALADAYYSNREDSLANSHAHENYQIFIEDSAESTQNLQAHFRHLVCSRIMETDSVQIERLTIFISTFPQSRFVPQALFLRSESALAAGDTVRAVSDLQQIIAKYAYGAIATRARVRLVNLQFARLDYRSAIEGYNLLQQKPRELPLSGEIDWAVLDFQAAQAMEALGNKSLALARYIKLTHRCVDNILVVQAMFAIARLAQEFGNVALARQYYDSLLKTSTSPTHKYRASVNIADNLFEEKSYRQAYDHYKTARQHSIDELSRRYVDARLIRCHYGLKEFTAAAQALKRFKKKYKNTKQEQGQFLFDKGQAWLADKNFEQAKKAFKKLKKEYKKTDLGARGEFGLGKVYMITNHTEDALEILTGLPDKYPDSEVNPLTYFNLGDFYYKSGQLNNAIHAFKQVIQHPKARSFQEKGLLYLIQCYNGAGMWDQAVAFTRQYLRQYPNSEQAFRKKIDIAQLLMKLKEYGRAIAHFRELQPYANKEYEAEIQFNIAQCFNESGNYQRAISEYLKVKYLTTPTKLPWHVTALFETGRCLLKIDETKQAARIFRRIIREQGAESNFGRFAVKQLDAIEKKQSEGAANGSLFRM